MEAHNNVLNFTALIDLSRESNQVEPQEQREPALSKPLRRRRALSVTVAGRSNEADNLELDMLVLDFQKVSTI